MMIDDGYDARTLRFMSSEVSSLIRVRQLTCESSTCPTKLVDLRAKHRHDIIVDTTVDRDT